MMNGSLENKHVLIKQECEVGNCLFLPEIVSKCPVRTYWIKNLMRDKALTAVPKCFLSEFSGLTHFF